MQRDRNLEDEVEDVESTRTLLDITIIPFEPVTTGSGKDKPEKEGKLRKAILEATTGQNLEQLKSRMKGRLVSITVGFFLWKGSPSVTNTRPVKDLDNLMKILFDVLGPGPQGLGLLKEDSYICEVYAKKELVDEKTDEGYRVLVEEYEDQDMLRLLEKFHAKKSEMA